MRTVRRWPSRLSPVVPSRLSLGSLALLVVLIPLAASAQEGGAPTPPGPAAPAPTPEKDPAATPEKDQAPQGESSGGGAPTEPGTPGGHEEPQPEPEAKDEKGPNLQIPAEVTGAVREELAAAIALWEAAEKALPAGPEAARGAIDAAIAALEAVRSKDGRCALPEHYLGIGYQLLGLYYGEDHRFNDALKCLRSATRLAPGFYETWVELGDTYGHLEKPRDAEAAYDAAIAAGPEYAHAYKQRAVLYVSQDRFAQARADVTRARQLEPEDLALIAMERQLRLVLDGPDWPRRFDAETKHYLIRTNVSQAFADKLGEHAELIRKLYTQIFPDPPRSRRKFPIVVFKDKAEYHQNGGPKGAGGHFDPVFKQLFLFQYPKESDTLLVLYHEGFHQFLDGVLENKPPQWFNEGVADFFGPSEHVTEGGVEGMRIRPNPWRLDLVKKMIKQGRTTPFQKLMTMTQREMYGRDAGLHYAQSWSMIYFFCEADDRAHFTYLKNYFKALRRGRDRHKAFELAFGRTDMAALEQRWREFILGVK